MGTGFVSRAVSPSGVKIWKGGSEEGRREKGGVRPFGSHDRSRRKNTLSSHVYGIKAHAKGSLSEHTRGAHRK